MNDFACHMGKIIFEYQRRHEGRGNAHPHEIIKGLEQTLKEAKFWYDKPEEELEYCDYCGYYCECDK